MKLFGSLKELFQLVFRSDTKEITVEPKSSDTFLGPRTIEIPEFGTLGTTETDEFTLNDHTQTLTNKTLTSPVLDTGVSGSAVDTDVTMAADSDTLVASQKAIKAYVDTEVSDAITASNEFVELVDVKEANYTGHDNKIPIIDEGGIPAEKITFGLLADANVSATADIDASKLGTGVVNNAAFNKLNTAGDDAGSELVMTTSTQTLASKTHTLPKINDTSSDHTYNITPSELTLDRTVTLPLLTGDDEFTFNDHTQTLTNKELKDSTCAFVDAADTTKQLRFDPSPGITGVNTTIQSKPQTVDRIATLPDATGTLVMRDTTDTFTNKTINGDLNTLTNLAHGSEVDDPSSGVHGVTGSVVGTTDTQTLTDKTLGDDTAFAQADVTIPAVPGNTFAMPAAPVARITSGTGPLNTVTAGANGDVLVLENKSGAQITITDNFGTNGFRTGTGLDLDLEDDAAVWAIYNTTDGRWNIVGGSGAGGGSSSITITKAAHGFAVADAVYFNGTTWLLADQSDAAKLPAGIISEKTTNTFDIVQFGEITDTGHTLTVGDYYFLSATGVTGNHTSTEPTTGFSAPLFQVIDANTLHAHVQRPAGLDETYSIGYNQTGTATTIDGALSSGINHGLGGLPKTLELWVEVAAGEYEQHDPATYLKVTNTQIQSNGDTLASVLGGSTNVIVRAMGVETSTVSEATSANLGVVKKPNGQVRLDAPNGHGSTNTKVRRFTNSVSEGTAITYADSATAGASLTINEDGIYSIHYSDQHGAGAADIGIGINASGTTNVTSLSAADRLIYSGSSGSGIPVHVSGTVRLSAGDVITPHTNGANNATNAYYQFIITQVAAL